MGLMDMFSIRDIRSFGKGFLGARVEAMQESARVAAEQKKFQDELKANETSDIFRDNEKNKNKAKIDAEEKERLKKERRNFLVSYYTVPLDYVDQFVPEYALESDDLMKMWIADQESLWGIKNWSTRKMVHGMNDGPNGGVGMTIPEWQMQNKSNRFSKTNAVDSMKTNSNIPDASADVVTDNKKSKKQINYNGIEVWNGKKTSKRKDMGQFINKHNGLEITAFQMEDSPGSDSYGGNLMATFIDPKTDKAIWGMVDENIYVSQSENKELFNKLFFKFNKTAKEKQNKSWMVKKNNKQYQLFGFTQTFHGDQLPQNFITSMDPDVANEFGLIPGETTVPGDLFTIYEHTTPIADEASYPFITTPDNLRNAGFNVTDYDQGIYTESRKEEAIPSPLNLVNITRVEDMAMKQAFTEGEDGDFTRNIIDPNNITFEWLGDAEGKESMIALRTIASSTNSMLQRLQSDRKDIPDYIQRELGLATSDSLRLYPEDMANSVGLYYDTLRKDLAREYSASLGALSEDQRTKKLAAYNITEIDPDVAGQKLADIELAQITTLDGLIAKSHILKEGETERQERISNLESMVMNKYFPHQIEGADLADFVNTYVTDPRNAEQISNLEGAVIALVTHDGVVDQREGRILQDAIEKYLNEDFGYPKKDKVSKFELQQEKIALKEKEVADLLATPLPPLQLKIHENKGEYQERVQEWINDNSEQWNELIVYINEQKPEVTRHQVERLRQQGLKWTDTPEYTKWISTYKKYLEADESWKTKLGQ